MLAGHPQGSEWLSSRGWSVCVSMELEWRLQVRALWFGSATGRFYIGPNLRYCLPYLNIEAVG